MQVKNHSGGSIFRSRNWKAILLSVFAAVIFWFFNALNKDYSTNLSFPVEFDYNAEAFIPVRPLPPVVKLNVNGVGWDLLRISLGLRSEPLRIPLEQPLELKKIVGASLPALIAQQLEKFKINYVITDTLHLQFEPRTTRRIKVALDTPLLLFRPGYVRTTEPTLSPDSITIEGPQSLITAIPSPLFLRLAQRNIDEDYSEDVVIQFLNNEVISRKPTSVHIQFGVDPLMERGDSIRVDNPQGLTAEKVWVRLAIPESFIDQYHPDSLRAIAGKAVHGGRKVLPEVVRLPPYAIVLAVDSLTIK